VIRSRIDDSLNVAQKKVLKIASVIGYSRFDLTILRKLCIDPELSKTLDSLRKMNLLVLHLNNSNDESLSTTTTTTPKKSDDRNSKNGNLSFFQSSSSSSSSSSSPSLQYSFAQHMIQAVVYAMTTPTEREDLHRQIAEYYESIYDLREDPSTLDHALAHHWSRARKPRPFFCFLHNSF
jgi:predicted ATPase